MVSTAPAPGQICAAFRARAYVRWSRSLAAGLLVLAGVSIPLLLNAVMFATDPPLEPPMLLRLFALLTVLPAAGARLIGRASAADVEVNGNELAIRRRGVRVEVPAAAIAAVVPWRVPLPGPGVTLRTRSGRLLRYGLQLADPSALVYALAEVADVAAARAIMGHPLLVYAHAKHAVRWRWYHLVAKFPLFALLPTAVLFNAHQYIAFGGTFGEYYLVGPQAYVVDFFIHWATVTIYLVLYAGMWRGLAEAVCLAAAHVAPSLAARVRRGAEVVCRVVYYGGVPVLLGIRFLP